MNYKERAEKIVIMRDEQRKTFAFIGTEFGITGARVRQIYLDAKAWPKWDDGLPARVKNILKNAGITSREEVIKVVQNKEILRRRNMGWQSYQELCVWLGMEKPHRGKSKVCPHCGHEFWMKRQ